MTLYHGSREGLMGPICPQSRAACDFGKGFYLGTDSTQPLTLICRSARPTLYACELDLTGTARACRQVAVLSSREIGSGECVKLQRRSETQRTRAAAVVDRIMDENRRDGLLFKELLERKAAEFA